MKLKERILDGQNMVEQMIQVIDSQFCALGKNEFYISWLD